MFISIDFNDQNHKNYIIKLSERNNFHTNKMYLFMYDEKLRYGLDDKYKGVFKIVDNKVVGFMIYFIDTHLDEGLSHILFILVDKKYQLMKIGSDFINNHILLMKETPNIKIVFVDAEDNSIEWYKKRGFYDIEQIFEKMYDLRHVISMDEQGTLLIPVTTISLKNRTSPYKQLYYPLGFHYFNT